jgi:hypothetical protein
MSVTKYILILDRCRVHTQAALHPEKIALITEISQKNSLIRELGLECSFMSDIFLLKILYNKFNYRMHTNIL